MTKKQAAGLLWNVIPTQARSIFFLFLSNSRFATLEKTRINFQVMLQFIIMEHFSFLEVHLASAKVQT